MRYDNITKVATALKQTFETNDPFKIASSLGINYRFDKLGSLKGFYTVILRNRYIVLNENLDEISSRIVCAHEIGHDRFHKKLGIKTFQEESCVSIKTSIPEIEANCFSAQLLIEDDEFLYLAHNGYTYENLACELNVHIELALIKAQILNTQGCNLKIPYIPKSNYLTGSYTKGKSVAAENVSNYKTY